MCVHWHRVAAVDEKTHDVVLIDMYLVPMFCVWCALLRLCCGHDCIINGRHNTQSDLTAAEQDTNTQSAKDGTFPCATRTHIRTHENLQLTGVQSLVNLTTISSHFVQLRGNKEEHYHPTYTHMHPLQTLTITAIHLSSLYSTCA